MTGAKIFTNYIPGVQQKIKQQEDSTEAKRVLNTKPSLELKNYAGNYHNEIYGDASIIMQGDSLVLKFPNNFNVDLSHWNYDTFQGKFEHKWYGKSYLSFDLNEEGKVNSFNFLGMEYEKKEQ